MFLLFGEGRYRNTDRGDRYFLTLTSFQPLYGKLSDIFGRKPALLFAYTVFGLGCLFCGLARNLNELVAARAFAGEFELLAVVGC
jgi:MFS family permease